MVNPIEKLGFRVGMSVVRSILGAKIHDIAEGKHGLTWQHRYRAGVAAASFTGLAFGFSSYLFTAYGMTEVAEATRLVATIGISLGLVNSAYQTLTPKFVLENSFYLFLKRNAGKISSGCVSISWLLEQKAVCHILDQTKFSCEKAQVVFLFVTICLVGMRILDDAWRKDPPLFPMIEEETEYRDLDPNEFRQEHP